MENVVYVDGKFLPQSEAKVAVFDHGLLYGDGVFEGIRAYNRRVFRLERHVERMYQSAKAIDLTIPHTPEEFVELIRRRAAGTTSWTGTSGRSSRAAPATSGSTPGSARRGRASSCSRTRGSRCTPRGRTG